MERLELQISGGFREADSLSHYDEESTWSCSPQSDANSGPSGIIGCSSQAECALFTDSLDGGGKRPKIGRIGTESRVHEFAPSGDFVRPIRIVMPAPFSGCDPNSVARDCSRRHGAPIQHLMSRR